MKHARLPLIVLTALLAAVLAACSTTTNPTPKIPITIDFAGTGSGTVSVAGKTFTAKDTLQVDADSTVTLTASADADSTFDGWSGCTTSTGSSCTLKATKAATVTATFTKKPVTPPTKRTLTVTSSGTGSGKITSDAGGIDCTYDGSTSSGTCSGEVDDGATVVLTAAPDAGFFTTFTGCDSTTNTTCTVTVDSDTTVTAAFAPVPVGQSTLGVAISGSGTGSVSSDVGGLSCSYDGNASTPTPCEITVDNGTTVVLTATPDGTNTASFSGGCDSVSGNACTVTVNGDTTVDLAFAPPSSSGATVTSTIATESDDAEEFVTGASNPTYGAPGAVTIGTKYMEITYSSNFGSDQVNGLRFNDVGIPQGAVITSATLTFVGYNVGGAIGTGKGTVQATIVGQKAANPDGFVDSANGGAAGQISGRIAAGSATSATVPWTISEAWASGSEYTSPNLKGIIQEIVDLPGWSQADNAIVLAIKATNPDPSAYRNACVTRSSILEPEQGCKVPTLTVTYQEP